MRVHIARWGNSLAVRIPKDIALEVGWREGTDLEMQTSGDQVVISPTRPRYRLEEMLAGITPEAMRDVFDWGPDAGREAIAD